MADTTRKPLAEWPVVGRLPASVVDVRGQNREFLERNRSFVYVGRPSARFGWKGSPWGNPFRAGMTFGAAFHAVGFEVNTDDRHRPISAAEAVRLYGYWLMTQKHLLDRLPDLQGKILGCWCCDWYPGREPLPQCHAVLLARMAEDQDLSDLPDLTKPPWTLS